MRGEDDSESLYAEKERLQRWFMRGNPEDEVSEIILQKFSGCDATKTTCPAGAVTTGGDDTTTALLELLRSLG